LGKEVSVVEGFGRVVRRRYRKIEGFEVVGD